jgi:glycosyltransferase involved in cell wall biosynthesis
VLRRGLLDMLRMSALLARDTIPWFGNHTGYEQLPGYLARHLKCSIVGRRPGMAPRYIGSVIDTLLRRPRAGSVTTSDIELLFKRGTLRPAVTHILYGDQRLRLLNPWRKAPRDIVATLHLPQSTWNNDARARLNRLSSAIVLYQRDIDFFQGAVGRGRVRFIRHGVDTDFFSPGARNFNKPRRILYNGIYLRNLPMLGRVIMRLMQTRREMVFDFLVPKHARSEVALRPFIGHPAVTWHAELNDEALRDLYRQAYLLLLPMDESGANTAVVEALSSGLPIVTTDVGGIRDYGGGSVFPVLANNDDDGMVAAVIRYLDDSSLRDDVGRRGRQFAEDQLAWPLIAEQHIEAYRQLLQT